MEALKLAMQMELEGEIFYRELAEKASNAGFREIFIQLAEDEVKHYQLFNELQQQPGLFKETPILINARNIFKQMFAQNNLPNLDTSQLELYQTAMKMEKNSQLYYQEKASETADLAQAELFRKIADEEAKHYFLLHHIYELVLRPQIWVENGEFVHLEEY